MNVDKRDNDGDTPLHLAVHGCTQGSKRGIHRTCVSALLDAKANASLACSNRKTPLQMAVKDEELKAMLLNAIGTAPTTQLAPVVQLNRTDRRPAEPALERSGERPIERVSVDRPTGRVRTPKTEALMDLLSNPAESSPMADSERVLKRERKKKVPFGTPASRADVAVECEAQLPKRIKTQVCERHHISLL